MGTDCLKHQELATARARNWSKIELWLDLMWLHKISSESTHQVTDGSTDKQDDVKVLGKVQAGRRFAWKELLDLEIERDLIEEREVFKLPSPPPNIWSTTLQHQRTLSDFCCSIQLRLETQKLLARVSLINYMLHIVPFLTFLLFCHHYGHIR